MDSVTDKGVSNDIYDTVGGEGEGVGIDVTWRGKGKSNVIDDSIGVRVNGMVVSGWGETASMDTLGGESDDFNDADDWNRGMVDVTSGCECCTKLDVGGTCRWPTRWPPLPRPLMGGTLIGIVNDGGLMDGPKDVDDFCVECAQWSSPITHKTSIAIQWVSFKSS